MTIKIAVISVLMSWFLVSCDKPTEVAGYAKIGRHVQANRVGASQDQWVEMKNMIGEWERTGLIFGYMDDYEECIKVIEGLAKVNYDRVYRCTPAN